MSRPARLDAYIDDLADDGGSSAPVDTPPTAEQPSPATIGSVLQDWEQSGPLVHEPTGIERLDVLTGGGPVYGTRVYLAGAPDAGKTALLIQLAHVWAKRGVHVGILAVDEEPTDLVTRFAQRAGYRRRDTEIRDPGTVARIASDLEGLPLRFYDWGWTIESAAHDLRAAANDGKAILLIDSLQTVRCQAELLSASDMGEVQAVTSRTRAIRSVATGLNLLTVTTSELGRASYSSDEARRTVSTLAGSKWSGSVEYSARILIGLRSVAGEKDLIDLEIAKNKHGPRDEHVYVRLDRESQTLWQTEYEPEPDEGKAAARKEASQNQLIADARQVGKILHQRPGIKVRELRAAFKVAVGGGVSRLETALDLLGEGVQRRNGANNSVHLTLDPSRVPDCVRHTGTHGQEAAQ